MAPEAYQGKISEKSDIWSLGVCLFYLLIGKLPFVSKQKSDLEAKIKLGIFEMPKCS